MRFLSRLSKVHVTLGKIHSNHTLVNFQAGRYNKAIERRIYIFHEINLGSDALRLELL